MKMATTAISRVFGYRDGSKKVFTGLLEKSDNGVLIIENFQRADEVFTNCLISYFKTGYYVLGDKRFSSSAKIIITANQDGAAVNTLRNEISICCSIPSLKERPFAERESLVIKQFLLEQNRFRNVFIFQIVFLCVNSSSV